MSNTDILDMNTILGLKEMGVDFFADLVETFVRETPSYFDELRDSLRIVDHESFRRAAHTLKSNANSFGAGRLAKLAGELEILGRDKQLETAASKIEILQQEYERVVEALKKA